jgi:hypothetical protein
VAQDRLLLSDGTSHLLLSDGVSVLLLSTESGDTPDPYPQALRFVEHTSLTFRESTSVTFREN